MIGALAPPISQLSRSLHRPAMRHLRWHWPTPSSPVPVGAEVRALCPRRRHHLSGNAAQLVSRPQAAASRPKDVIDKIAAASEADGYLRGRPEASGIREAAPEVLRDAQGRRRDGSGAATERAGARARDDQPQVAILRKRLKAALPPATDKPADENFYDDTLKAAVMAFQTESGTRAEATSATRRAPCSTTSRC